MATIGRASTSFASITAGVMILSASVLKAQTDARPIARVDSVSVRFPSMMLAAHVGGRAHLTATIDSGGRLIRDSLRVVDANHALFANAAKEAMIRFAYEPARRDGRAVAERIDLQFEFRLPSSVVVPTIPVWRVEQDTVGYRIITGWDSVLREIPAPALSDSDVKAAREAILDAVRHGDRSRTAAPLSTEFKTMEAWTSNVVGARIETVDYPPPPHAILGGGGRSLWCQALRPDRRSAWVARCDVLSVWVS